VYTQETTESVVKINIPFTPQIPDGKWVAPYRMACEEASMVMVDEYYAGKTNTFIEKTEAKQLMQPYFIFQNALYGSNKDSNAIRTSEIIKNAAHHYNARVVEHPTIEDIQAALDAGHPVISFHHGYSLKNKYIKFANSAASFHVIVLVGYDENKKIFYAHEPAMMKGDYYAYPFEVIMNSMRDYNHETHITDGSSRVLFTSPINELRVSDIALR